MGASDSKPECASGDGAYPAKGIIPLPYHVTMLADRKRCIAFLEAIDRTVRPGHVVFEPGAGTGLLSFFAARVARRVYAVELERGVAAAGRSLIRLNGAADRVCYLEGPAQDYVPPEPVDVVICEMLHVGLVNEQQVAVLNRVRERLAAAFPGHPYRVIPEGAVNYCQLVEADFDFYGYQAPLARLGDSYANDPSVHPLSDVQPYWTADFGRHVAPHVQEESRLTITQAGTANALRLMTQAILLHDATRAPQEQLVDWYLNYLILPLPQAYDARLGARFDVRLTYDAGCATEHVRFDVTTV